MQYDITPPKGLLNLDLSELWRFRDLFSVLVWRDIKVRYKQTIFGAAWAIFQPFVTMIIFTVFFGGLAKVPSDNVPYPVFVYSGLLLWNYFSVSLTNSSNCLIDNESVIKKVYFPRLILPLSTAITPIIDFIFAMLILFAMMVFYHVIPTLTGIFLIPILLFLSLLTASGLGLFLSAVNAKYRDIRYILPFFIQSLMFLTPIIYPISIVPQRLHWLIYLNPMAGIISTARASLLNTGAVNWQTLFFSAVIAGLFFWLGVLYFRKTERYFADVL